MTEDLKKELIDNIEYYGVSNQRDVLNREYKELQDELYYLEEEGNYRDNLLSECVDVINVVLQFLYSCGFTDEEFEREFKYKVYRQKHRREEEKQNEQKHR